MRPGDLILWYFQGATGPAPNHVTMYIGGGKMVEASGSRGIVVGTVAGRGGSITAVVRPAPGDTPATTPPVTPPTGNVGGTYRVVSGDTLSKIAAAKNVAGGWQALYNLNKAVIGSNPNLIFPGQVLRLP